MKLFFLFAFLLDATSAFSLHPTIQTRSLSNRRKQCAGPLDSTISIRRHAHVACVVDDADSERERLRKLGEEEAARQAALDSADDGDELMKEFNARLAQEGGATKFKLKTDVQRVADEVQQGANQIKGATQDAAAPILNAADKLPPNFLPIVGVMIGLSVLPSILVAAFG
uniref:Uncharacterized protein n=1 Tax=Coccolithus braarudii TaxID=221442 RepID=A0A7S0LD44_9EUKA|mmetsp:Transcript_34303/g.73258  ORF Transcript_34303/g.73258 Transcript_34303/m.73258 type:complete len:170 (+) Transcript_34303:38-547(+)